MTMGEHTVTILGIGFKVSVTEKLDTKSVWRASGTTHEGKKGNSETQALKRWREAASSIAPGK